MTVAMIGAIIVAGLLGASILLFILNFIHALKENVFAALLIVFLGATCFYLAGKL